MSQLSASSLNFPIIDTHLHLWNPNHFRMSWLDQNPLLNQVYELAEYRQQTAGIAIEAMVYLQVEVETPYALLEARWVSNRAAEDKRLQGMVPWAPLEYGEQARAFLDALAAIGPLTKSIRRIIQFEPDIDFCLRPDFVRGVQKLAEYDVHARSYRKARHKKHVLDPWRAGINTLAGFPNVWCKMSGLTVEADLQAWTRDDLRPYIDHVLASFGFGRTVFGGDWPVVLQAARYPQWVEALLWAVQGSSQAELRQLFHDNARAFYRLG